MGEVVHRIRASRCGERFEQEPHVSRRARWMLKILFLLGLQALFYFADYWFHCGGKRGVLFVCLTFAVFWGMVRSVYDWWVFLWADHPDDLEPSPKVAELADTRMDVLTTAMPGEPFAMFEGTLTAISKLEGLNRAYLLDGGNDPLLASLCERLGVIHVDCREISGAKAGKVNFCLTTFSEAPFVLVIDPDHIPRPNFLTRVLPYFRDPEVGFVQVVQAYYNVRDSWVAWAAAEQTFGFYGATQLGLGGLGIPTAIGANCTFRRAALDSIGGHAEHLAEDALTSMRLHAQGWKSVYLPWRGSSGLVPTDLGAFWKQQLKWATGMCYLLFQEVPTLLRRFGPRARLHYLMAASFYLGGVASALNLLLPILFLFAKVYAVNMPLMGFLLHIAPYLMVSSGIVALAQRWGSHREERGFPWRSALLEKATWHVYLLGAIYGATGRKVPYLPTPKEGSDKPIPWLVAPHWVVILLSFLAIAWIPISYPRLESGTLLMAVFAAVNALMLLPVAWQGIRGWFRVSKRTTKFVPMLAEGAKS